MHKQIQICLHCSEVGVSKYSRNSIFCFLFVNEDGNIAGVIFEIEFFSKPFTNHEKTSRESSVDSFSPCNLNAFGELGSL